MAEYRADWADALDPVIRKLYNDEWDTLPQTRQNIFNMLTSSKKDEKDSSASGLSQMVEMPEGTAISYEDANQGYDVTYTHKKFGLGSQITYEMFQDDQHNVMSTRTKALARAKQRTLEQSAADVLNFGFTSGGGGKAQFLSGGDAVALFSASHPRTDGGAAQSNYTTADLAEDSLETALVSMRQTVDDKGQLILIQPDTLVVAPALEKEAMILLNTKGRVGTANNDINPYEGRLKLVVWDFLGSVAGGSDTAWFVLDSKNHRLNWFTRDDRGLEGPHTDFDTKTAKWSVVCRWSVGFSDWRGAYGSKGDNS